MPNPWFTEPADFVVGGLAKAEDVNSLKDAIASAFDLLTVDISSRYTKQAKGNLGATPTFDLSAASYFTGTVDQAITSMTISGAQAGSTVAQGFVLELTNGGAFAITWPASIKWAGDVEPILTSSGKDVLAFVTSDNGATWHGTIVTLDSR